MIKVLIWQVSNDISFKDTALEVLAQQHGGVKIVGEGVDKVETIGDYDLILCVGVKVISMDKAVRYAANLKLDTGKLLGDWIACIPGFKLEKYRELQQSRLSIFSMSCFGGLLSNTLGLPFLSPFVNLALTAGDFLKFLNAPNHYMKEELRFNKTIGVGEKNPTGHPLIFLGDITLDMVHYKTAESSINAWNNRRQRINWDNLFVVMYTDSKEILARFDALPFGKKVCFVPFKSELDSAWYVNQKLYTKPVPKPSRITEFMIHDFARGNPFYYDVFDMLLYGKKTPLINM